MEDRMRKVTCITALAAVLATPAVAWYDYSGRHVHPNPRVQAPAPREIHDSWRMTCYPTNGAPFDVVTHGQEQTLSILGKHGVSRDSHITSMYDDGPGFTIEAVGDDYKGDVRHLRVHFESKGGYLWVLDRELAPSINCGSNISNSDD
jgi:hypothetical protein